MNCYRRFQVINRHLFSIALIIATPLAFGALRTSVSSETEQPLQSVTVTAKPPVTRTRFDVRTECPGIDQALQESLSPAWGRVMESGSTPVRFRVKGHEVTWVWSSFALSDYRSYIRRAVEQLACGDASGREQEFAFELVIRGPDDQYQHDRLAPSHR